MPLPDDLLRALGRVAVNFQTLERFIAVATGELIGPDQTVGMLVTVQLPFGKLCSLAKALFSHRVESPEARAKFEDLLAQALRHEELRNQYFHSSWGADDHTGQPVRVKSALRFAKGLTHHLLDIKASDVHALADAISKTAENFLAYCSEVGVLSSAPR